MILDLLPASRGYPLLQNVTMQFWVWSDKTSLQSTHDISDGVELFGMNTVFSLYVCTTFVLC